MIYGELETGFRRKTYAEIRGDVTSKLRRLVSEDLTLDELDWVGNLVDVFSDELSLAWEALEVARNQQDPDNAEGSMAVAAAALTGTYWRAASYGTAHDCVVTLAPNKAFAAGELVASVSGDPTNRWLNAAAVAADSEGGQYEVDFVAENPGAFPAYAGTLTVIAQTKSGWLGITNPTDATMGRDLEEIEDLRVRRELELADQGATGVDAVRAGVLGVTGVIQALPEANESDVAINGVPARTLRVLVWDGPGHDADDDEIATAIFQNKGATTPSFGAYSGFATDEAGNAHEVFFDRAEQVEGYVTLVAYLNAADSAAFLVGSETETALKAAVLAAAPEAIGERARINRIRTEAMQVPGVRDIGQVTLAVDAYGSHTDTSNIVPEPHQIITFDTSRITITTQAE